MSRGTTVSLSSTKVRFPTVWGQAVQTIAFQSEQARAIGTRLARSVRQVTRDHEGLGLNEFDTECIRFLLNFARSPVTEWCMARG